jgi:hypothetical protein
MNRLIRFCIFILLLCSCLSAQQPSGKTNSYFDIPVADFYARYRYIDNTSGAVTADDFQYRFTIRPTLRFNETGTYETSRVESGTNIGTAWSNTGIGRNPGEWAINVKTLYIGQHIGSKADIEVGAMDFEYGAGTEATYADFDSYTEGYRLRLHGFPGRDAPSKIALHIGYVGDFNKVNAFRRLHRLGEVNYIQVLAEKELPKKAAASVQYDRLRGLNLIRAAAKLQLPDHWWINEGRVETVARMNDDATAGWAVTVIKTKNRFGRFNPGLYYSHIPTGVFLVGNQQAILNGDIYGLGKRLGWTIKNQVTKQFDLTTLITRRLDSVPGFRWRAQIVGRFQFASMLKWLP